MKPKTILSVVGILFALAIGVGILLLVGDEFLPAIVMALAVFIGSFLGVQVSRKKSAEVEAYRQELISGRKSENTDPKPEPDDDE